MHLIYVDESGNTGDRRDPEQPVHLLAGLVVHEAKIRPIEDAIEAAIFKHFGPNKHAPGFELHAAELYSGRGAFKGIAPATRIAIITDVIQILVANEVAVIWTAVNKMTNPSAKHPHQLAFLFLVERIEDYLKPLDALGLIVADEHKELEQALINDLRTYKASSTAWGYRPTKIERVVDSVHFVKSENNRLIQCADLVAYFLLKSRRQTSAMTEAYFALEDRPLWPEYHASWWTPSRNAIRDLNTMIYRMVRASKLYPD